MNCSVELPVKSWDEEEFACMRKGNAGSFDSIGSRSLADGRGFRSGLKYPHLTVFAHGSNKLTARAPSQTEHLEVNNTFPLAGNNQRFESLVIWSGMSCRPCQPFHLSQQNNHSTFINELEFRSFLSYQNTIVKMPIKKQCRGYVNRLHSHVTNSILYFHSHSSIACF